MVLNERKVYSGFFKPRRVCGHFVDTVPPFLLFRCTQRLTDCSRQHIRPTVLQPTLSACQPQSCLPHNCIQECLKYYNLLTLTEQQTNHNQHEMRAKLRQTTPYLLSDDLWDDLSKQRTLHIHIILITESLTKNLTGCHGTQNTENNLNLKL